MKNKFVSYLNTLHNASGCNEHSIAENNTGDADEFHNKLQFERAITKQLVANIECPTAHCERYKPHFDFGDIPSPIVPHRNKLQT